MRCHKSQIRLWMLDALHFISGQPHKQLRVAQLVHVVVVTANEQNRRLLAILAQYFSNHCILFFSSEELVPMFLRHIKLNELNQIIASIIAVLSIGDEGQSRIGSAPHLWSKCHLPKISARGNLKLYSVMSVQIKLTAGTSAKKESPKFQYLAIILLYAMDISLLNL